MLHLLLALTAAAQAALPPTIAGENLAGPGRAEVALSDATAKASVVAFVSSRCPCSMSHQPILAELSREFAPKGIRFVGVHSNADEPAEEGRKHFTGGGLPFPVVQDEHSRLADAFGALKTPHVFVVQAGEVVFEGGVDDSRIAGDAKQHFLRDALTAVAAGKKPAESRARALGCVIRRE